MTSLLLSAGEATRLRGIAPGGCKAMTIVGGLTMVGWWTALLGRSPTVVCRSEHLAVLPDDIDTVICDSGGGPARALEAGLAACAADEPVTVAFADTWLPELPDGPEWCAVAAADPGRSWDVVEDGIVYYGDPGDVAVVCIGAYRFAEAERLATAVETAIAWSEASEVSMGEVVNTYRLPFVAVNGWQDVGDPIALNRWRVA